MTEPLWAHELPPLTFIERTDAEQETDFWYLEPEFYLGLTECRKCAAKADEPCWSLRHTRNPQRAVDWHHDGRERSEAS